MSIPGYRDAAPPVWNPDAPVDPREAEEYLRLYYRENPHMGDVAPRLAQVWAEIATTGVYTHTRDELTFGAQVAWRNASRCIGRLYWRGLLVRDMRHVSRADEIFTETMEHLRIADGSAAGVPGRLRAVISIFPPAVPGRPYPRIWNEQLIRYAGYRRGPGDPGMMRFTEAVAARGWRGTGGPFDVLPLVVETPEEGVHLYDLPADAVLEVPLSHPELPFIADLDVRWYAVPAISNMRLSLGGVNYPLAPFNGWYMGTEIGSRNLADADRYNLVPRIARGMGLDTSTNSTLWRDRALVELNRAVLYSFEQARVRITDHHTESERFITHVEKEQLAGRLTPADWSWIVPPLSGGATPVFHRYYPELDQRPNFYLDPAARELGREGRVEDPEVSPPVPRCPMGHGAPERTQRQPGIHQTPTFDAEETIGSGFADQPPVPQMRPPAPATPVHAEAHRPGLLARLRPARRSASR
jgi:nitric-oxide synthase